MKRLLTLASLVLVAALVVTLCKSGLAEAKKVTLKGEVSVTRDDDDNIIEATLTADGTDYCITLDKNGKKLAAEMDGKMVEVTGTVTEKDGEKWLTVESYKELPEDLE